MTQNQPKILLITADDMNWDAVVVFGCLTPDTTPNIDRLAAEGIRFENAHVTIAVCQPSRSAIMTGHYPHQSGGEGFHKLRFPDIPILPDRLREAGYAVGILGKVDHSTSYANFEWDYMVDQPQPGQGPGGVCFVFLLQVDDKGASFKTQKQPATGNKRRRRLFYVLEPVPKLHVKVHIQQTPFARRPRRGSLVH